ncbi:MAG: glycine zipper 2TM domain-containing protein [Alphaproteobacteria bacterium]|nr:glycine zipper 2TM domain-containing protein [Alphaproteobacteria bacterium]
MDMKTKIIASSLLVATLATGCENPKQAIGTLGGGALGAWAGSTIGSGRGQIVATAVGAVAGALAGGYIGQQLDQADRAKAERTYQSALESSPVGKTAQWRNPDSGNYGTITPVKTYQGPQGYCREFQQTVTIGGRTERAYGTACRQPDGSWQLIQP